MPPVGAGVAPGGGGIIWFPLGEEFGPSPSQVPARFCSLPRSQEGTQKNTKQHSVYEHVLRFIIRYSVKAAVTTQVLQQLVPA